MQLAQHADPIDELHISKEEKAACGSWLHTLLRHTWIEPMKMPKVSSLSL
jgi:hypothetical protein